MALCDRLSIIQGPAIVKFDGQSFYSQEDISVNHNVETFDVETSIHAKVDERVEDITVEIEFTPVGVWKGGQHDALFPYKNPVIGSSVLGPIDKNVVIHSNDGNTYTYMAGAITQMPNLTFSATKQFYGACKITCVGKNATAWTDAGKRVEIASLAFTDNSFDSADIITQPYKCAWGTAAPWDDFVTEEGITFEFDVQIEPRKTDVCGTVDLILAGVNVMAKLKPIGPTEQDVINLLNIQGANAVRGRSLNAGSNTLQVRNPPGFTGNTWAQIYGAAPKTAPFIFGRTTLRHGELAFVATRTFSASVANPLFDLYEV